jgi:FixJ family two-component response regulator
MTLPWRIAIIDDERSVRSGLSNLLESEGYSTDTFDSAEVFLSHPLALSGAALVITDIKLRGMSGLELFDKLRLLAVPPPPVLFISGHADENMQRYALVWAPLHFCVSPLTSIFCWIIFSGSWPADNKDRG